MKISELKEYFSEDRTSHSSNLEPQKGELEGDGPGLFCGYTRPATKQELLAAIPPRPMVDRLVAKCFASMDLASGMLCYLNSHFAHAN